MHTIFIQERVTGTQSIWEKMKQKKLLTFKSEAKTLKTKLEGQVVELKEDRALMQRILVVSQKRSETDLHKLIGQYKFSITPRSLRHTTFPDISGIPEILSLSLLKIILHIWTFVLIFI